MFGGTTKVDVLPADDYRSNAGQLNCNAVLPTAVDTCFHCRIACMQMVLAGYSTCSCCCAQQGQTAVTCGTLQLQLHA